jgi:hypothetical protein
MFRKGVCVPILGLFFISLGGLLLHLRVHPPTDEASNWIPAIFGVLSVIVLPLLFNSPRTVPTAYILNAVSVVVGTVAMAWYSIEHWQGQITWDAVLLKSTLADILILLAKLPIAHMILRHFHPKNKQ